MKYCEFTIDKNYISIYIFLKEQGFSENYISNLRKEWGNFVLNGNIVNIRSKLFANDKLKINASPNKKTGIMQCILPLNIVYEDEYYLLINKPSGISCMPNRSCYDLNLAGAICAYMSDKDDNFVLRILNRLDKDTAGIIIVAKDSVSQNRLKDIQKIYHAIVVGKIDKDITIDKNIETITRQGVNQRKREIGQAGKSAITHIHPIAYSNDLTIAEISLEHGRTHQIRVHLSSIGHPLLGDELYGESSTQINHACLICKKVSFYHPFLNKMLIFEVDYPDDIKHIVDKIRVDN